MLSFLKKTLSPDFIKTLPKFNMERTLVYVHALVSLPYVNRIEAFSGGYELKGISDEDFKKLKKYGTKTPLKEILPTCEKLLDYARKNYEVEISSKDFWFVFWQNRGSKPKEAFVILEYTKRMDLALEFFSYVNQKFIIKHYPSLDAIQLMNLISQEFFFVEEKGFILHNEKYTYGNGDVPLYIIKNMNPKKKVGAHYKAQWMIRDMGRIDFGDFTTVYSFLKKGKALLEILSKTNMSQEEATRKDIFKIKNYYNLNVELRSEEIEIYWPKLSRTHKRFLLGYILNQKKEVDTFLCKKIYEEELTLENSDLLDLIRKADKPLRMGYLLKALLNKPELRAEKDILLETISLDLIPEALWTEVYKSCLKKKREIWPTLGLGSGRIQSFDNTAYGNLCERLETIEKRIFSKTGGKDRLLMIFRR